MWFNESIILDSICIEQMDPIGSVTKLVFNNVLSFAECSQFEGTYLKETFMKELSTKNGTDKWLIDFNCDGYHIDKNGDEQILFIYRKGVISEENSQTALKNLKQVAIAKKINRGSFSGRLDRDKMPKYVGEFYKPSDFRTRYYSNTSGKLGNQLICNMAPSNIVGYFDKQDRNLHGSGSNIRGTAFIRDHPDKWSQAVPYYEELHAMYHKLFSVLPEPNPYSVQLDMAKQIPNAMITNTIFSTATVNYSCPSALHTDKGNMEGGAAVLSVIVDTDNENSYTGAYLCLPQFGICIDNNHRDLLIGDNKYIWHGNTEFIPVHNEIFPMDKNKPKKMPTDQEIKNSWYFNRFVTVCYIRDSILKNYLNKTDLDKVDTLGI
jgi:hypothetical protein